jgi:hypothetical protein
MSASVITPQITRYPLFAAELIARDNGGYAVHEAADVKLGGFTCHVWRNATPDGEETRLDFDVTLDGLADASGNGLGSDPERLRELASVTQATADELGEAWARQRHPAGSGLTSA